MMTEKECRVSAGRIFADLIGFDNLLEARDRIVTTQAIRGNSFIMSFGIFDEIINEGANNYADKLLTVNVDMNNGDNKIDYLSKKIQDIRG